MRSTRLTFPLYLGGAGLSLFGNAAIAIVLPWLVISRTGDPSAAAVVAAAAGIASVPATFFAGRLTDRFGHRNVAVAADVGSALSVAAIAGGRRDVRALAVVVRRPRRRGRDLRRPGHDRPAGAARRRVDDLGRAGRQGRRWLPDHVRRRLPRRPRRRRLPDDGAGADRRGLADRCLLGGRGSGDALHAPRPTRSPRPTRTRSSSVGGRRSGGVAHSRRCWCSRSPRRS